LEERAPILIMYFKLLPFFR